MLSKTLPFVIESGSANLTTKNIYMGGRLGRIGVAVSKK